MPRKSPAPLFVSPIPIYTAQEVAAILKVSSRTVERLIASQQLLAVHVGRRLRVTQESLQAYISQAEGQHGVSE